MSDASTVRLWQTLRFTDTNMMIGWLEAIGFVEHAVYRDESDSSVVHHAEYLWPGGGGIMFGTHRPNPDWPSEPGTGAAYLVADDPDELFARAVAAGATGLYEPRDEDYGGRGAAVTDPEGNLWSFGSYQPS